MSDSSTAVPSSNGSFDVSDLSSFISTYDPKAVTAVPSVEGSFDPQEITNNLIESRLDATASCPLGFICDGLRQANCTNIRAVTVAMGFGDVHGGGYCPEGVDTLQICPVGHYCPSPEIKEPCPPGYFCPHKTAKPEIICQVRVPTTRNAFVCCYMVTLISAFIVHSHLWMRQQ
jgi:hypothetical protein